MPNAKPPISDAKGGSSSPVAAFPGACTSKPPPANNLPLELNSFIGREREMAEVKRLLKNTRLLTLTGPGGCGKTRLALRVANDLVKDFEDGVWLVELASLSNPALLPQAVASVLGVREQPIRPLTETLSDHLRPKQLLLVLDNCEHLVGACAKLVEALLRACPDLRILATSREALGSLGETTWLVPSLSLPDPQHRLSLDELPRYEAARLFLERAAAVLPTFTLTNLNTPAVVQVCRKLDGIPLAIELAAARVKVLAVEQIAGRLDECFRLLVAGSRTALPRQQTLRAAIDWSHELLSDEEQTLFRRLSVFAGSFTLEAAEAVCVSVGIEKDEVLDLLSHLVDKSLVVMEEQDGEAHYRLLETIRQYAQEKLEESGEAEATRDHYTSFFLRLAEEAEPGMLGPEQDAWVGRLEREHDNLRAALGWLREQGAAEQGLRLGGALGRFWWYRGYYTEGRAWLEELLGLTGTSVRVVVRAKALYGLGVLIYRNANYDAGDQGMAHSRLEESLRIYRELRDVPRTAAVLRELGRLHTDVGEWAMARSFLEESLGLERQSNNEYGIALTGSLLGILALLRGEYEPARVHLEEHLEILRRLGGLDEVKRCLLFLGFLACNQGDYATARARLAELMEGNPIRRYRWPVPFIMLAYAHLAAGEGQAVRALRLAGAAAELAQTIGTSVGPAYRAYLQRGVQPAWEVLGEEEGAAAWEEGQKMALEEAIAYALEEPTLQEEEDTRPPATRTVPDGADEARPEAFPAGLTAREAEVLGLLASGKINKEIAQELVLSVSTVQRHVANIYAKIGARGRAEATAYALSRGITRPRWGRSPSPQ